MPGPASLTTSPTEILVVDDDRGFLRLVEKTLQREGFATAGAGSFQEAVDWLDSHRPDLMLLDLKLEDIGGKELIDYLTVNGKSVPFIIMTGQGDERVAVAMMKRGAINYLVKDAEFLQLVPEEVRRALGLLERDKKLAAAEEALRRSEGNLARAQQIAHLGSFEINASTSQVDYCSEEILRILGIEPGHASELGLGAIEKTVYVADLTRYQETLRRALQNAEPFRLDYRVVRPDGSLRHVQSVVEPIADGRNRVSKLVGTLLDITERKQAELRQQIQFATTRVLAESATLKEAAPALLEVMSKALEWEHGELWQVDTHRQTLSCVECWTGTETGGVGKPPSQAALGPDLPTVVAQAAHPLWVPDLARYASLNRAALARLEGMQSAAAVPVLMGTDVLGTMVFYSREIRPADEALLQTLAALGSQLGQFIERKRTAEALQKENAFTAAVLDTSAALVVVLDRNGQIVRFNRAAEQTTGYSTAEVRGRFVWDLFLAGDEKTSTQALFGDLVASRFPNQRENFWLTRGGDKRLVAWSNSALRDISGAVEYVISIGIDVTEQRRLEREILQVTDTEQRRIGQDLHDGLCQHLAATELMSETLERRLARKSKADARRVAEIAKQVREAISQTRLLARGLVPVVLESEGLMSALEQLADYSQRMFRVNCVFRCEKPVLIQDHTIATHLYRIAQEAVSNAIRHGKAKRIVITFRQMEEAVVLEIKDAGVGLTNDTTRGNGMGLRIMRYRASMIGGFLTIESEPGVGTTVQCTLRTKLI